MNNFVFGTSSPLELVLTTLFTILLFAMFIGAIVVPIVWKINNTKDKWPDYNVAKRIRVILAYLGATAAFSLLLWRSFMPSNF
jgi:hypothetical protein